MSNPNIIVDASVLAKWFLPDEGKSKVALTIKDDFAQGNVSIALPSLVFYEINNLLKSAVIRLRIEEEKALKIYQSFLELDFEIYITKEILKSALGSAIKCDISSYDASYVALAQYLQIPLYTADHKLLKKVKSDFVKSLDSYLAQ